MKWRTSISWLCVSVSAEWERKVNQPQQLIAEGFFEKALAVFFKCIFLCKKVRTYQPVKNIHPHPVDTHTLLIIYSPHFLQLAVIM